MRMYRNRRIAGQGGYGMMRGQRGMGMGRGMGRGMGQGMGMGRGYGIGAQYIDDDLPKEARPCYYEYLNPRQRGHVEEAIRFHEDRLAELKSRLSSTPVEDED